MMREGACCTGAEGQSQATNEREEGERVMVGPNFSDPALWPTKMTSSDRVKVVRVMAGEQERGRAEEEKSKRKRKSKEKGEMGAKTVSWPGSTIGPHSDSLLLF